MAATVPERIEQILTEIGPMTRAELDVELGMPKNKTAAYIRQMRSKLYNRRKRLFIKAWTNSDEVGGKPHLRAIYAVGDRRDAPKPKRPPNYNAERCRAYRAVKKSRINSVFALGSLVA